ncbi:MAG TPA: hypothetical protein VKH81_14325 [Candidatus Angelobacter sp.]|nr:hypothetical protein [Candidatus Angelobacter sp.]
MFTGLGLSLYQSLTHTWSLSFLPTSITLFFTACGLFLLYKIGWRGLLSPLDAADYNTLKTWGLALLWVIALWVYLQSSFLGRVLDQDPKLRAYFGDPACSSGAMYKLAKTAPQATPTNVVYPVPSTGVCTVRWVQAQSNGAIASHPYRRYADREYYRGVHKGDMLVVQTAFGNVSAVLYPSRNVIDWIFSPRGKILETRENPMRAFEGPFMENFWFLFFFLFFGSAIMLRLIASFRN